MMSSHNKEQRFQAVMLPHLDSAFNLARWLALNQYDAEDIVQESYLRAFKFFDGFHGDDGRAWLLGIVRNTFFSLYQKNKMQSQHVSFEEELHGNQSEELFPNGQFENNPESLLIHKDNRQQVEQALRGLPVEFREVVVMRELDELSYKQIASIVGIPIGTVMSRLGRGRKQLAQLLKSNNRVQDES